MKRLLAVLAVALMLPLAAITGCAPGIKATKPSASPEKAPGAVMEEVSKLGPAAPGDKTTEDSAVASQTEKLSPEELEKMLPPPPPSYKRDSAEATRALPASPKELLEKEEINASALEFAKGIPNVKHVKTCFSRMFGGWYLHLYVAKGKKIALQHYSWNPVSREWDVSMAVKELPLENLEHHLRGEVGDEQCSVLK
jgi:hypothetical protein